MTEIWQPPVGRPIEADEVALAPIVSRHVAMIGFGTMGRAQALNLRDSGVTVRIGLREGSAGRQEAVRLGFDVATIPDAVAAADVVMLMLPDEAMVPVFKASVAPHLSPETLLGFAHGFAVAYAGLDPGDRGCFLVAPKSQGDMLRAAFVAGGGAPGLLAVTPGSPAETWPVCAAYARAVGCLRGGGWVTTFAAECTADQFGEQVVLCGGVIELLQAAFDTLTARGHDPVNAYFECVHELKLITDLVHRYGVDGMRRRISPTAAYGGLTRGRRVIDDDVRARMAAILDEIEDGRFAREFLTTHDDPRQGRQALTAREESTPLVGTGRSLQDRMAALQPDPTSQPEPERDDDRT